MFGTGILENIRIRSPGMASISGGAYPRDETDREAQPLNAYSGGSRAGEVGPTFAPTLPAAPRRGPVRAALVTMRPRQWIKNALVVAAAGAAGALGRDHVPVHVALACGAFCMVSSGIYAINDVRDRHEDRLHPRKRFRPVAQGELSPGGAVALAAAALAAGFAISAFVRPLLVLVVLAYVVLTLSYTFVWRHVLILDLFAIAGGFVLRAIAGGVAAPVALSRWFVLVITAAAVLVAAGKRQSELRRTEIGGAARRRVLDLYTPQLLRLIITGSAAVALFAYSVWALQLPTVHGIPWRPLTIIPFAACLLRYGALVRAGAGETPEDLLLSDRWLLLAGLAWLVLFALGVHAAG
jgi:decaprenyl-phosphate phosphoribosyltransferase